ncbi:MAG: hypothetical protein KF684_11495 [Phycisphaeraceae bacterium]|nr:hypothetical protein [Phycisphaeraceae bacterium]
MSRPVSLRCMVVATIAGIGASLSAQDGPIYLMDMDAGQQCQPYYGSGPSGNDEGGGGQIGSPAGYIWAWTSCSSATFTHPCPANPFQIGWFNVLSGGAFGPSLRYSMCCGSAEVGAVYNIWVNGVFIRQEHRCRGSEWPF